MALNEQLGVACCVTPLEFEPPADRRYTDFILFPSHQTSSEDFSVNCTSLAAVATLAFIAPSLTAAEIGPLQAYVDKKDDSFRWVKRRDGEIGGTKFSELILTSQKWKDTLWKHQLFVIQPSTLKKNTDHALLVIEGGRWHPSLADLPKGEERLPGEAPVFAAIAEQLATPVAVLLQVPQQPIFDGKVEDQAIAHTFAQFLKTGDDEWPLLLPMTKSAVRGMDAVQQFAARELGLKLQTFTVSGASKRGWTTWLTGAVDPRATAIAPMVIDMLNMGPQMKHQVESFGDYSPMINDYTDLGLQKQLETKAGKRLVSIVDPFSYRTQLTQPKLVILGTNDPYWPVDALNLYWNDLAGEKYILYVPNNAHGLRDIGRLAGSINALHKHTNGGPKLAQIDWRHEAASNGLTLRVSASEKPQRVRAWVATSPTRDFRPAKWVSHDMTADGDEHVYKLATPTAGYAAVFGEAVFDGEPLAYYLSTTMRLLKAK
jgi:PhoPQ-activated pathogenicity-related protein